MPRKVSFDNVPKAMASINQVREFPCYQKREDGVVTFHHTIPELVRAAKSGQFDIQHSYEDRVQGNAPTRACSEAELAQVERLAFERFVKPFLKPRDEDDEERDY